jgi:proteasome accessory factor B
VVRGKKAASRPEARLMRLAAWLLARREPVAFDEIREQFGKDYRGTPAAVDKKWTRDKQALVEAGVPIAHVEGDPDRPDGYVVDPRAYYLPDLRLAPEEWAVLWTAGRAALRAGPSPWRAELESALRKLRAAGAPGAPPRAAEFDVYYGAPIEGRRLGRYLEALGDAWKRRKRVHLRYFTAWRQEETERDVDVYGIALGRRGWMFAGFCHLRGAMRVFDVDHVRHLKVNAKNPSRADYVVPRDFRIGPLARARPWAYHATEPMEATVRLQGALAGLAESLFPGADVDSVGGEARVRLIVRNLDALVRQALELGPEAELVAPERGRAMARRMLASLTAGAAR